MRARTGNASRRDRQHAAVVAASRRFSRVLLLGLVAAGCAEAATYRVDDPSPVRANCIVGENAIGCLSERTVAQITTRVADPAVLRETIQDNLASGACRLFDYGERVYVTATDARGLDRKAVRRPGDAASYWMPASWSRPADECRADASLQSLREKIGIDAGTDPEFAAASEAGSSDSASSLLQPHAPGSIARAKRCEFKPVMSDADIAACRYAGRQ